MAFDLDQLGERSRSASRILATASSGAKDEALVAAAAMLEHRSDELIRANESDLEAAATQGVVGSALDRLKLDPKRIASMSDGLRQVASLPDPVGRIVEGWVRPNGLKVSRVRVPLGVVGIVYENRPNVTSDASGLCVKAGNAVLLRGSSSAINSNIAITAVLREALGKAGLPEDSIGLVEDTSRATATRFMQMRGVIDCLIPRGGPSLINSILEHATVPYVIDGDGNCHVYVDEHADLSMALDIVVNAKMQRPSVCNAAESLVVHRSVADEFIPRAVSALEGVELVGDPTARAISADILEATEEDFAREFLDLKMSVAVVDSLDCAIEHINRYSSGHSEAIVTRDYYSAQRFTNEVDAAAVLVNASTRFIDGGELGLGAEIGISTQKLHARGPMGLEALTTVKFIVQGEGQVRN
ncbi:MAG TPA: glutamate-5-semialdehyde dehydrogenase [Acidimicrobiales bacterium]|nr:glutamate-5-semialdehyde dehydrogenase [Acidimicrobiales bacterium]